MIITYANLNGLQLNSQLKIKPVCVDNFQNKYVISATAARGG